MDEKSTDIISVLQADKSHVSTAFTNAKEKLGLLLKGIENGQTLTPEQLAIMRSEYDSIMKAFNDVISTTRTHIQEAKS